MGTETQPAPRKLTKGQRDELLKAFGESFDRYYQKVMASGVITAADTDGGPFIPARMAILLAAEDFDMMAPHSRKTFKEVRAKI